MWERIAGMTWSPKERGAVQVQAVSSLSGIDVRIDKVLRVYAQALAFAPDGRLWLGHTGAGSMRWDPETDRLESRPLERAAVGDSSRWHSLATGADVQRLGPPGSQTTRTPSQSALATPTPRREATRDHPYAWRSGRSDLWLLAWAIAPGGSHAAAILDEEGTQQLLMWNADSGKLLYRIPCRTAPESPALPGPGLAFAPDASQIAVWDGSERSAPHRGRWRVDRERFDS